MAAREITVSAVDFLVWSGAGAAILVLTAMTVRALWQGHIHINGRKATKHDEPLAYALVILAFCGCICFLWPVFWGGLSSWLAS
jgi:hypothetical protein